MACTEPHCLYKGALYLLHLPAQECYEIRYVNSKIRVMPDLIDNTENSNFITAANANAFQKRSYYILLQHSCSSKAQKSYQR
jgi:hypothetical protein